MTRDEPPNPRDRLQTDPRFRQRRAATGRSRRRKGAVALLLVVLFAVGTWVVFGSTLLRAERIRLVGARRTSASEVARAIAVGDLGNLLLVSTTEVETKVEELPWVKAAEVDRMLPDTLRVKVTERRPFVVLSLGAARWSLDRHGRVLTAGAAVDDLPTLGGVEVDAVEVGAFIEAPEVASGLRTLRSLAPGLRRRVVAVFAPSLERLTLSLDSGLLVRYGAAERLAAKNAVLQAILERVAAGGKPPAYVDVRVPTSPAIGPPAGQVPTSSPDAAAQATPSPS